MNDVERQRIEHICERLIREFAFLNDAHDHDALAELFTEDGSFARPTDPDNAVIGREQIRIFFRDRSRKATCHVMANTVVDVLSEHEAAAQSYVMLYTGHNSDKLLIGEFCDAFRFDGGQWRFQSRRGSLKFP
ncbi:nuclear transport factor 2 family protein [Sphingomonas bisphenolicum]|uniref:SnoaL-like domain-containing protein n=1 Tax=Sphingomonas bisphenolicum TaxID=296544 RepID=A0ABM7GA11_9SPHN|nr:nuclear transport factor 2 family protein [Sphingomonas bisphenolicum]BBF72014.1 hypothetical protein SBA_ch2_5470 [Sphingomonas bisphenolicum]